MSADVTAPSYRLRVLRAVATRLRAKAAAGQDVDLAWLAEVEAKIVDLERVAVPAPQPRTIKAKATKKTKATKPKKGQKRCRCRICCPENWPGGKYEAWPPRPVVPPVHVVLLAERIEARREARSKKKGRP